MLDPKKYKKMSQNLQAGVENVKEELANQTVEGVSGGGALRVIVNGNQDFIKVEIKPEAVDPDDIGMLEDLFLAAANQAMEKAKALQQKSIGALTGGMNLPNLPFI